jgi:hypothetical protein
MVPGKIWPAVCFVNKVLLGHSHAHSFAFVHGCFHTVLAELSSWGRDLYVLKKNENVCHLLLYRKRLLTFEF